MQKIQKTNHRRDDTQIQMKLVDKNHFEMRLLVFCNCVGLNFVLWFILDPAEVKKAIHSRKFREYVDIVSLLLHSDICAREMNVSVLHLSSSINMLSYCFSVFYLRLLNGG